MSPSDHAAEFCLTASFADVTEGTVYTETLDSLYETLVSKLELETPAASPIAKAVELIHWNDAEERTQEEVLELLGETIRRLRSGEEKEAA